MYVHTLLCGMYHMYKRHVGLTGGGRGLVRSMHADLDLVQIKNDGF